MARDHRAADRKLRLGEIIISNSQNEDAAFGADRFSFGRNQPAFVFTSEGIRFGIRKSFARKNDSDVEFSLSQTKP